MRILFIVQIFPKLSETFIFDEMAGLIDRGHQIEIISLKRNEEPVIHEKVKDFLSKRQIVYVTDTKRRLTRIRIFTKTLLSLCAKRTISLKQKIWLLLKCRTDRQSLFAACEDFLTCLCVADFILHKNFEIIYCHFGTTAKSVIHLKKIFDIPFVVHFHGYDFSIIPHLGFDLSEVFVHSDIVFGNSSYTVKRLRGLGCPEHKLKVIGYGIDLATFPFKIRRMEETCMLLTVARLVEKKGLSYSIEAVAKCMRTRPHIRYTIIGDGELREELRRLIQMKDLGDKIHLLGSQTQEVVKKHMTDSHIFILSSVTAASGDTEGLGVVLLEAQATGMPVAATQHNGFFESVKDGYSGYLVPERDVEALAERIGYLVDHPETWERLGREGRSHIAKNYSAATVLGQLENTLEVLLKNAKEI